LPASIVGHTQLAEPRGADETSAIDSGFRSWMPLSRFMKGRADVGDGKGVDVTADGFEAASVHDAS
jgi:hypothetical protein